MFFRRKERKQYNKEAWSTKKQQEKNGRKCRNFDNYGIETWHKSSILHSKVEKKIYNPLTIKITIFNSVPEKKK